MKSEKPIYLNRELSWLSFNQRVLDQAYQSRHPLLERVKFLAISAANLDEFFMVRVGGLSLASGHLAEVGERSDWNPGQQLDEIRTRVREMYDSQANCLLRKLEPELETHGVCRVRPEQVSETQREHLLRQFRDSTMSTVAPIAVENPEEFPLLVGARLCMCVRMRNDLNFKLGTPFEKEATVEQVADRKTERYVLLPLGKTLTRFWSLPCESGYQYMLLEDVIEMFLGEFFPNQEILESALLRVTRNGDVVLDEDGRGDLLIGMQAMLEERRTSGCIRLEVSGTTSRPMLRFLEDAIGVCSDDVYTIEGPLALSDYFDLVGIQGFSDLRDAPWPSQPSPEFSKGKDIFETIAAADRMLYHPYQSYEPVIDFLKAAASDPDVIAIKQTLYRTSRDSEIVQALEKAAANGKYVTVIVELKARFDEARNIHWAHQLEHAGVDVIYGVRGLKTHAKMCLVVRRESTGIRRYVHFGTGNYNEATARLYSDMSLFTCDEQLGSDSVHFFNAITGLTVPQSLGKLVAAPINLRETLFDLIQLETESANQGAGGMIMLKVNSLVDSKIIDGLYAASQAGVKVRLNVRGICCLVPQKKGLSENIKVVSVVDRFLEHARIFHFQHGGDELLFVSSADLMGRNLDRRVELMIPIEDAGCKSRLFRILKTYFDDNVAASVLNSDGTYSPVVKKKKKGELRAQAELYDEACQIHAAHTNPGANVFEPRRG